MNKFDIIPKVDETQEFIEIANDFSNPLEIVREAISNSFDANSSEIKIEFNVVTEYGEKFLEIKICDNGNGMNLEGLQSFFDLGNSLRRNDSNAIGEKGHGTKIYLNSSFIQVTTIHNNTKLVAKVYEPFKTLFNRQIPRVEVIEESIDNVRNKTEILIKGYNNNRREKFTHENLKDYILWFTKFGSVEQELGYGKYRNIKLYLKGLDRNQFEEIKFGHVFPQENSDVNCLFSKYLVKAPDYYCKKLIRKGQLKDFPEIQFEAVFYIEGNNVKHVVNPMLRRRGYQAPTGSYTVQERYGLWLCKDYIPIQRKNEWIIKKGSEYTKFHAFINCQDLRLTANRSSVDNTPFEILEDIKDEVSKIYNEIINGSDWNDLEWLEEEASSYTTIEKEKTDFDKRRIRINKSNICRYKNILLVQPQRESGVFALTTQLLLLEPDLFPFKILDYDTHSGLDVIVKGNDNTPIYQSKLFYVEFKYILSKNFNHSFQNLHSIVCWDISIVHNDVVDDIGGEQRKLSITPPEYAGDYTRYYLDNRRSAHRIEVFVLKTYLEEKLGINFKPRTEKDFE